MSRPALLLAVLGLLVLPACGSQDLPDDRDAVPAPTSPGTGTTSSAPGPSAVPPATGCEGVNVVDVVDEEGLQQALDDAAAGQVIRLADGRYDGGFVATARATLDAPIRLCGSRAAVLDGGDVDSGYTLHLDGASYWHVSGFTINGGQKGVMVDGGVGNRIDGLMITSMGDEAIHLRANSTDNVVADNTIRDTGLREPKFGEGIYVGSAESNWCELTDCEPDRSDRNLIEGNDIAGTTAEAVDIKEGTSDGVLRGNSFDGSAMVEADSWVDVKGNSWTIERNVGTSSREDGFQVHEVVDGWGRGSVFARNTAIDVPGLTINVAGPRTIRESTTIRCDNTSGSGRPGVSNVDCGDR